MKELQKCLEYCQKQNGRNDCKNCGLNSGMIHRAEQEMLERVLGVIEGMTCDSSVEFKAGYKMAVKDFKERLSSLDKEIINPNKE